MSNQQQVKPYDIAEYEETVMLHIVAFGKTVPNTPTFAPDETQAARQYCEVLNEAYNAGVADRGGAGEPADEDQATTPLLATAHKATENPAVPMPRSTRRGIERVGTPPANEEKTWYMTLIGRSSTPNNFRRTWPPTSRKPVCMERLLELLTEQRRIFCTLPQAFRRSNQHCAALMAELRAALASLQS